MAAAVIAFAGAATLKAAVIKIGLQVALTAGLAAYQRRQQKNELRSLQAVQGQNITVEGGSEVAPVIYGEACVGGVVAYANSITERAGSDGIYDLHQCVAHSYRRGGIDGFSGFFLNDAYLRYPQDFDSDGGPSRVFTGADPNWSLRLPSANPQAGVPGVKAVRVQVNTGGADQEAPMPLVNAFPEITTAFRGRDLGWSYWRFRLTTQSSDLFNGGPPNVRAVVRGAKVYNASLDGTRTTATDGFVGSGSHRISDPTTWQWSDNPAWCIADYLMSYVGIGSERINWLSFHNAASACVGNVSVPGTAEPRWRCDVVLSLFERHDANLQALLDCCDGTLTRVNGLWTLDVGGVEEAAITITPDDIIGQAVWHSNTPLAQRTNIVGGQYRSRNHDWQDLDIPDRRGFELRQRDGRDIREDLALAGVSRGTQAQRLAERRLRRQDAQQRVELPMTWRAFRLQIGTRFNLDLPIFTEVRKFRVTEMSIGSDQAPITVTAIEEPDTVWADMTATEYHREDADGVITRAATGLAPETPALPINLNFAVNRLSAYTMPEGVGGDPPYSYSLDGIDAETMTYDEDTRRLEVRPTVLRPTTTELTYTVADRHNDQASATARVRYVNNTVPFATFGFPQAYNARGVTLIRSGIAGDATRTNPIESYEVLGLPEGATVQGRWPATRGTTVVLTGGASAGNSGLYRVWERLTDVDGDVGRQPTLFNTQDSLTTGRPLAGTPPNNLTATKDVRISPITIAAASRASGTLTYTIDGLPPGLSWNAATRQISGTPSEEGDYEVRIIATDSGRAAPDNTAITAFVVEVQP